MNEIGIVGKDDRFFMFSIYGAKTFVVKTKKEAEKLIESLILKQFAIILISNSIFNQINETILKYDKLLTTTIISIPDGSILKKDSKNGLLLNKIKKAIGDYSF